MKTSPELARLMAKEYERHHPYEKLWRNFLATWGQDDTLSPRQTEYNHAVLDLDHGKEDARFGFKYSLEELEEIWDEMPESTDG